MARITAFEMFWLLFFFIPLLLIVVFYDSRLFVFPITFLIFELWRTWTRVFGVEWVPTPQRNS